MNSTVNKCKSKGHTTASSMMKQMADKQGITEQLKATDPIAWVGAMNNIKAWAEEIVINEIVYA